MSSNKFRIAIFASGNGSNAEKIIRHFEGHPSIEVAFVLTNNPNAFVITRARNAGVPVRIFNRDEFTTGSLLNDVKAYGISHIVLAGFLMLIPKYLIHAFPDRIINIHPALLPKFGGKGMYGLNVHEAVKAAGEVETGITIHLVNERYDDGRILFQGRCRLEDHFTPREIAACVQQLEYEHYPRIIESWILNAV